MRTSDFYYELPQELIAQDPLEDRSSSRLLHLSMEDGSFEHRHFTDILDYLKEGDCLVINDTRVIVTLMVNIIIKIPIIVQTEVMICVIL